MAVKFIQNFVSLFCLAALVSCAGEPTGNPPPDENKAIETGIHASTENGRPAMETNNSLVETGRVEFHIPDLQQLKVKSFLSREELAAADTLTFIHTSNDGFHSALEKTYFVKGNGQYLLHSQSFPDSSMNIHKIVPPYILDSIVAMQSHISLLRAGQEKSGNEEPGGTREEIYLVAGKNIFKFSDAGMREWNDYDAFKKRFIIPR